MRRRFVKGTITKTTGGNHNMYSNGNIVTNAGGFIRETADGEIIYGDPVDAPPKTLFENMLVEGDFFDMSGNYLGSTRNSKKMIFITGRDVARIPYIYGTLPKEFYEKDVSFTGIGNIINSKIGGIYGTIITDLSVITREKVAEKIFNYYYTEAGFNLNELKYKTITNADDLDRHLDKVEIQKRNDRWTDNVRSYYEGTGYGITRIGGYTNYSKYLKKYEAEISIGYGHIGLNLDSGYDIMSILGHEHKHLEDCINDLKNGTKINSEHRAYNYQTLVDKNWPFVSFRLKANLNNEGIALSSMYVEDYKKAFGDLQQYVGFNPIPKSKNIVL